MRRNHLRHALGLFGFLGLLTSRPLRPFLAPYMPWLPVIVLLGAVAGLLEGVGLSLIVPLFERLTGPEAAGPAASGPLAFLDQILAGVDALTILLILVAMQILKSLVDMGTNMIIVSIKEGFTRSLMLGLGRQITRIPLPHYQRIESGRFLNTMDLQAWLLKGSMEGLLSMLQATSGILALGTVLLLLDWRMFALVLAIGLLALAAMALVEKRQRRLSGNMAQSGARFTHKAKILIDNRRTISVFGSEERELKELDRDVTQLHANSRKVETINALIRPVVNLGLILTILFIGLVAYFASIEWAVVVTFILVVSRLQPHLGALAGMRAHNASYGGALAQVEWLLQLPKDEAATKSLDPEFKLDRSIGFNQVSFSYADGQSVLENASFELESGSITALVGPSGSGKSTIVSLLLRLLDPGSGQIRHGELDAGTIDAATWRSRIGLAGQGLDLFPGTIADNILYGDPAASAEDVREAARIAGIDKAFAGEEDCLNLRVEERGVQLSGGQRQRVALARALVRRPDLLILDEATNAVDAMSESEIIKLLVEHRRFHTALVISHRKNTLAACDRAIIIENGTVSAQGPAGSFDLAAVLQGSEG